MGDDFQANHDSEPIRYLKQSIAEGRYWYYALLEAIALWDLPHETCNGRHYQYLIEGEAFDWLLLAERLCLEIEGSIPEVEKTNLLFGKPPMKLSAEEFRIFIGKEKYRAHLNFFYGVVVEQVLQLAVEMDIEKERQLGANGHLSSCEGVFQRIYGLSDLELMERFRREKGLPPGEEISIAELNHFTYWLFKFRVANCDRSRVGSDTKKALELLQRLEGREETV